VTVILKPAGRGNWTPTTLRLEGHHHLPLLVRVGTRLELGGVVFRICEVRP